MIFICENNRMYYPFLAFIINNKIYRNTVFVFCPHLPVYLLYHVYFAWKMRWGGLTAKIITYVINSSFCWYF